MKKTLKLFCSVFMALTMVCPVVLAGCSASTAATGNASAGSLEGNKNSLNMQEVESNLQDKSETSVPDMSDDTESGESAAQTPVSTAENWYIRTDGDIYRRDTQKIYITAGAQDEDAWVGVYAKSDMSYETPLKEYNVYAAENAGVRYTLPAAELGVGEYTIALFAQGAGSPRASVSVSVVEDAIYTNKTVYKQNEDVIFRFFADVTVSNKMWYALYKSNGEEDRTYGSDYVNNAYKYTCCWRGYVCGVGYSLQEELYIKSLDAGDYELVLFSEGYTPVAKAEFTVAGGAVGEAEAPSAVSYNPDSFTNGTASGGLTLMFAPNKYNADEVVAYWANESGVLAGYAAIATQRVTGSRMQFYGLENVMIPEGATNIRFYGKNVNGQGSTYYRFDLPEGCGYKAPGEEIAAFAVLSDTHVSPTQPANTVSFTAALTDIASLIPGGNIIIAGDCIDGTAPDAEDGTIGPVVEWNYIEQLVGSVEGLGEVYYALGNHDLYKNNNPGDWATVVKPYQDLMGLTGGTVWYSVKTGGVWQIVLGSQGSYGDKVSTELRQDQLDWLESELDRIAAEDPSTPVFVYLHQPMTDTTAGTLPGQGWNHVLTGDETWGEVRLKKIMDEHPQAFMLNGHNHKELTAYRVTYFASTEQHNHILQTAGTAYIGDEYSDTSNAHQGWLVYVYEGEVIFRGRDFVKGEWLPGAYLRFAL